MGGHIRGIMSHSYKEPFIGGVCSAVWARREGNWKCPPRIYGVRNGEPWARRTLGGEGGEFRNSEFEEEKSSLIRIWDDPNISEGMRRKYHIWEVTVVSASGRKNHLDSPLSYSHFPLHSTAAQQFSKSQIQIQTQVQRQMQGKIQRQTQRHLKYSHLPWHSAEQFSAAQVLHNPLYSWDVRAASPSSVLKS